VHFVLHIFDVKILLYPRYAKTVYSLSIRYIQISFRLDLIISHIPALLTINPVYRWAAAEMPLVIC